MGSFRIAIREIAQGTKLRIGIIVAKSAVNSQETTNSQMELPGRRYNQDYHSVEYIALFSEALSKIPTIAVSQFTERLELPQDSL